MSAKNKRQERSGPIVGATYTICITVPILPEGVKMSATVSDGAEAIRVFMKLLEMSDVVTQKLFEKTNN